jgi:hypothetical protein
MKCSGTFMWIFLSADDALEVDVQHQRLEGVHLVVAQQHLLLLAVQVHGQDGSVERFLLQAVEEGVVVQLDRLGRRLPAVEDAGHLARAAQAAARSGALQFALVCDELDFHWLAPVKTRPRPAGGC